MELCEYSDTVQHWMKQVLDNREVNAEVTLKYCKEIIEYGKKMNDCRLMGFGYYYSGETYYGLNDGAHFFDMMGKALSNLNQALEWELMVRCYNFLGIAAMNRGNIPVALEYYLKGLKYCKAYHLQELNILLNVNLGMLYIECRRYDDAKDALERAYNYLQAAPKQDTYYPYLFCIYGNLTKGYVLQEKHESASELLQKIHTQLWEHGDVLDKLSVCCVEVLFDYRCGMEEQCREMVQQIEDMMPENLNILDFFYDLYSYCTVLLEMNQEKSFWKIIDLMEPLVRKFNITNLQLKIISLKIQFYRKHEQNAEYLQAAGLYYELSERMEEENRNMTNSVITLRKSLEWADRARVKAEEEKQVLKERSELDPLTKMANRFRLNEYSEEIFAMAEEKESALAVEILDIDYFKEMNDNYGHQAGDRCLVSIARAIQGLAEENRAFAARYGGDEFVIIYDGVSYEQACGLAAELKRRIMELKLEHKYSKALPIVTVSQGICYGIPGKENRMWDFLHTADEMLYRVKKVSRNNYRVGDISKERITVGDKEE